MSLQELALRAYRVGLGLEYDGCISGNGYKSLGHMGYVCRMGNNAPAITVHLDKLENQRKRLTEYEQRESILKHKEIEIEQKEKSLKEEKIKFEEIKSFTEQHESTLKQKETEIDERENLLKQKETTYKQIGEVFDTLMEKMMIQKSKIENHELTIEKEKESVTEIKTTIGKETDTVNVWLDEIKDDKCNTITLHESEDEKSDTATQQIEHPPDVIPLSDIEDCCKNK